uniref:Uncharacterized protein n=1 Tax=Anguilla anguilla TaxID=7936 RepID=A0A0E9Q256_ANGAN
MLCTYLLDISPLLNYLQMDIFSNCATEITKALF